MALNLNSESLSYFGRNVVSTQEMVLIVNSIFNSIFILFQLFVLFIYISSMYIPQMAPPLIFLLYFHPFSIICSLYLHQFHVHSIDGATINIFTLFLSFSITWHSRDSVNSLFYFHLFLIICSLYLQQFHVHSTDGATINIFTLSVLFYYLFSLSDLFRKIYMFRRRFQYMINFITFFIQSKSNQSLFLLKIIYNSTRLYVIYSRIYII